MANYTKTTDFAAKDTLPGGDTNKVVRGAEFETEFDAISTAIATKSDTASPTFTGTVTIPTVDINAGAIDGTVIGASSAAAATFTNLTATTADINAGTIDNAVIGGSTAAAGTFTDLVATSADINGGTLDGATIGGSSAGAGTFTNLTASGTVNFNGATVSNLGTITTANLDGGTADNIVIGGSTPAAGTFTSVVATTADINGGTADNVVIGGSTAAAGTFTTLAATSATVGGANVLTSVAFSNLDAGAVTTSGETFADSDTQIPTNAAVKDHVEAVIPTLTVTEASVTQHQAALALSTSQITSGTFADARVAQSNVTQHQAALAITQSQITGGVSPTFTATASGTLANGDTVIVNSNGTVSKVGESVDSTPVAQSAVVFESATTDEICATFDSNLNKVVIAYKDEGNSNHGTAVVGTISGTTITFGTPVVWLSSQAIAIAIGFDSNSNKVVIAFNDFENSQHGKAVVGTVSGTSISFGSVSTFESAETKDCRMAFDSNLNKMVIAYRDNPNSNFGTAVVATVSGTSISFGTPVVFESAEVAKDELAIVFDSNANKVVISYSDGGNSNHGTAIVGTVSGTSISFGTAVVFEAASTDEIFAAFDSNSNKVVISYQDEGNSNHGTAIVGTVSGTSISFGSAVVFEAATTVRPAISFDSNANKVVIAYRDEGNSNHGTAIVGTVSGTSISFGSAVVFEAAASSRMFTTFDSNANTVVIAYRDEGNSNHGTSVVFQSQTSTTNLTTENYIGISNAAYSDGATATIQVVGAVDDAQSSLTPGQSYFVQNNGSLGLTAGDPSVFAGTAVAATKLIVKG